MKGIDDESADRKEWTELFRNTKYLKETGLMMYVIPSYRYSDKRIARYLATHFYNVGIMRFSDEDFDDYRQCIFIGNKKSGKHKEFNQKLYDFLIHMESDAFVLEKVTPVDRFVLANKKWNVPAGVEELKTFYTKLAKKSDYVNGIRNSKGFQGFMNRSKP